MNEMEVIQSKIYELRGQRVIVKTIIQRAVKGKPLKDSEGNSAGKGHFHNMSDDPNKKFKIQIEELLK